MTDSTVVQQDAKSILESKTFWGTMLMLFAPVLAKHGIVVDDALTIQVSQAVGAALAIYGRFTAKTPVKLS
jgi:hypothetical protein